MSNNIRRYKAYNKMINGNTRRNEREYEDKRKEAPKILRGGGGV
jgi:hypothetical protein